MSGSLTRKEWIGWGLGCGAAAIVAAASGIYAARDDIAQLLGSSKPAAGQSGLEDKVNYVMRAKSAIRNLLAIVPIAVFSFIGCDKPNGLPYVDDPNDRPCYDVAGDEMPCPSDTDEHIVFVVTPEGPVYPVPECVSPYLGPGGAVDFYAAMKQASQFAVLFSDLLPGISLDPDFADANGPFTNGTFTGDGIPDFEEFSLIDAVLSTPSLDLSIYNGVDYQTAADSWNHNVSQMAYDLGEKAISAIRGSETVLPGYVTLGDADSTHIPVHLSELAIDTMPFLGVQQINLENYVLLPQYFGALGDCDGDGTNNFDEYMNSVQLGVPYASLALDPCKP